MQRNRANVFSQTSEIKIIWNTLPEGDFADIVKVFFLTGQRATEISDLRWDEIDFEKDVIRLPSHRTKIAAATQSRCPRWCALFWRRANRTAEIMFSVSLNADFSGWSKAKRRLDEAIKIPEWQIHDLRRTAATGLGELGVFPHVIEAILNHVSGTRTGVAGSITKPPMKLRKPQRCSAGPSTLPLSCGSKKMTGPAKKNKSRKAPPTEA